MGSNARVVSNATNGLRVSKKGRITVSEDPMPGQTSTSKDDCHVETVREMIHGNRRRIV